jgi:RNA polymerase sigma-70 factor (ECF subfamily)
VEAPEAGDGLTPPTRGPGIRAPARAEVVGLDEESAGWVQALSGTGAERDVAFDRLHEMLVRAALREVRRRATRSPVTGPALTDVAHQAASDAMVAILAKLATFRDESRFTTWAYRFVVRYPPASVGVPRRRSAYHTPLECPGSPCERP